MYCLPNICWDYQSRRIRWAGHVALAFYIRNVYKILVANREGKKCRVGDIITDGRTILKLILK